MGIGLLQLVIPDVSADKIMNEKELRNLLLIADLPLFSFAAVSSAGPVAGAGIPAAGTAKADFLCLGGLPDQLFDPGPHGLLLSRNLLPVRQIYRHHLAVLRAVMIAVFEFHRVEDLRMIHADTEINLRQLLVLQQRNPERGGKAFQTCQNGVVSLPSCPVQLIVIVFFHTSIFSPLQDGNLPQITLRSLQGLIDLIPEITVAGAADQIQTDPAVCSVAARIHALPAVCNTVLR